MEESDIIKLRKFPDDAKEVKNPSPNIAGMVLSPNTAITIAPSRALAVLAAAIAKK